MRRLRCDVMIIGGGVAGATILRDLSMRGLDVVLIERNRIASGSSFASHQNLVGGLRYVIKNSIVAKKCAEENGILSRIAPELIGEKFNFFVGFRNEYVDKALDAARRLGVRADEVSLAEAFAEIPELAADIDIVVETDDRNFDVRAFCLLNCAVAKQNGGIVSENTEVFSIKNGGEGFLVSTSRGEFLATYVVNATGPWLNFVCEKVGVKVPLVYSQGTIVVQKALSPRGLQFLHEPSDGDAYIVHDGEAWLGTTSTTIEGPESAGIEPWAEEYLKKRFGVVLPCVRGEMVVRSFVGVRALFRDGSSVNGRALSRDFMFFEEPEGVFHVVTGKLTLARLMAEKVADKIMDKEGNKARCRTHKEFLASEVSEVFEYRT